MPATKTENQKIEQELKTVYKNTNLNESWYFTHI